ncbi:MAG: YegS/Rv2252/BmrU family lipid kinase [Vulcanimicrobiaceae bacterium]
MHKGAGRGGYSPHMRIRLIFNEKSRRGTECRTALFDSLRQHGIEVVEEGPFDAVVAAGGDGTIVISVGEAIATKKPLGIIPLGTFNDLARTVGIPLEIDAACEVIAGGATRRIDVGRVNGIYFVNEASIGVSTRIARRQTPEVKQRFGFLGVIGTTLQTLNSRRPFFVRIQYDQHTEEFKTVQLTVANSHHFGGFIEVPDAAIDDGFLDLFSVEVDSLFGIIPLARSALNHDTDTVDGLRRRRAKRFAVQTRRPHHVSADGEPAGFTPAIFEVLHKALQVLVPNHTGAPGETSNKH